MNVLFVCSQNFFRSLTAERIFVGRAAGHSVRSAGTEVGARVALTLEHIEWADVVFVMETYHVGRLRARFGDAVAGKRVICLHIPDEYNLLDAELVSRLESGVASHVSFDG